MKRFLEKNKIFFDVFSSIALGIMAIIISYQSNKIADYQAQLSEHQTMIMEAQLKPIIEFDLFNIIDPLTNIAYEQRVDVSNVGHEVNMNNVSIFSILEVDICGDSQELYETSIWIADYFNFEELKNSKIGLLQTSSGHENKENLRLLEEDAIKGVKNKYENINMTCFLNHIAKVEYVDILDNIYTEYYMFNGISQFKIENTQGEELIQKYKKDYVTGRIITLSTNDGKSLLEIIIDEL